MTVQYDGSHSITFLKLEGERDEDGFHNSWTDFHLIPASRPYITVANPKIQYLNLPRSKKILDLTYMQSSGLHYDARSGNWDFYIDHNQWDNWEKALSTFIDYFDGSAFEVILNDESTYVYKGRLTLASYSTEDVASKISIGYSLDAKGYTASYNNGPSGTASFSNYVLDRYGMGYYVSSTISINLNLPGAITVQLSDYNYPYHTPDHKIQYYVYQMVSSRGYARPICTPLGLTKLLGNATSSSATDLKIGIRSNEYNSVRSVHYAIKKESRSSETII